MALTGGAGLAVAESGAEARGNGCLAELGRASQGAGGCVRKEGGELGWRLPGKWPAGRK